MYATSALTLAAALFSSASTAAPLVERDLGAPFDLTVTPKDGSAAAAPLAACHTGAGQEVLCAYPGGGQAGAPFNFNTTGAQPVEPGFTSTGALVWEEFPDSDPPTCQNAVLAQGTKNIEYASFGYGTDGEFMPVAFTSSDYMVYIINTTSIDYNFYLCPYSNYGGYNYSAIAHAFDEESPEVDGCTAVFVNRVF